MKRSMIAALMIVPGMAIAGDVSMEPVTDSVTDAKDYDGADIRPTAELDADGNPISNAGDLNTSEPQDATSASATVRDTQPINGELPDVDAPELQASEPQDATSASATVRDTQPIDGELPDVDAPELKVSEPQDATSASAKVRDDS